MSEEKESKKFTDYLAFAISALFSPYVTAAVFIIIVTYAYAQNLSQFLPWMITFLAFAVIIPGIYTLWLMETGKIADIHMSGLKERKIPFLIAGILAIIGALILIILDAAKPVIVMGVTYAINALAVALVTQVWKISVHTALFSAISTIAVIIFGPFYWWLYLILIPLSWSRIHRHRHTIAQVVAGALLAFVLTTATFFVFGYL
ncbi:hypothetical protein A2V71_01985 [Candidatus Berkelbacteria bacterium RBG_13_40_8]|uniref:Phosphatidic acid phosphatase type 2/haloperoxidase domain-containing protein n=1 Tax=Candidatus Berkelbacteria bacterium RBG_13_40_8 TaxID=1797467 RepID=A0A1F5DQ74_9BACT|nr:MAG: hypothetical protein A2V71_01985 [Candidatus Berkelbacteria bacterium RBG_13_40_8]